MLKQILHQLLHIPQIRAAITGYQLRQKAQRHQERRAMLMRSGGMVR